VFCGTSKIYEEVTNRRNLFIAKEGIDLLVPMEIADS
jgi:hypothetical protein